MTVSGPKVKLYLGDCLEFIRGLPAGAVDAVVTDPPYGVAFRVGKSVNRYGGNTKHHNRPIIGDDKEFDPSPFLSFPVVVMFGANNFANKLPNSRGWIYWHKRPGMKPNDFGDGELIYTNQDHVLIHYEHMWNGVLRASEAGEERYHPTQKPIALMAWLIERYTSKGDTVFDPFMGSGTTGVAAVQLGRRFIGCEIDPGYFAIAKWRIEQAQAQPPLPLSVDPPPAPEQAEFPL